MLGGEPLEPENQTALAPFIENIKAIYPGKTIWIYTGFTYERLFDSDCRAHTEHIYKIIKCADVLVDGPFIEERKNLTLRFRGSDNQRIIDRQAKKPAQSFLRKISATKNSLKKRFSDYGLRPALRKPLFYCYIYLFQSITFD